MYICPVSTSPVRCSYFTLGNPEKVILNNNNNDRLTAFDPGQPG